MAEERTYQGNTYRRNSAGEEWVLVGPAGGSSRKATVFQDPMAVYKAPKAAADIANVESTIADREADNARSDRQLALDEAAEARASQAAAREESAAGQRATRLQTLLKQIERVEGLYGQNIRGGMPNFIAGNVPFVPTNEQFNSAAAGLAEQGLAAFRVPGVGSQSDNELRQFVEANRPRAGDTDLAIEEKLRQLRLRASEELMSLGVEAPLPTEIPSTSTQGDAPQPAMSADQATLYDAFLSANPEATAEQLRAFSQAAGIGDILNAEEIIAARAAGSGVRRGDEAQLDPTYQNSLLGQGMSGVNEGLAAALGFPVDAATALMNLVPQGINAVANTNIPTIQDPFLGGQWWNDELTDMGTIYDPSGGTANQMARRTGQSLGAAAVPIGGMANTARQAAATGLTALTGGLAGATAQQVAPGNLPVEVAAEILASGGTGLGLMAGRRRANQAAIEATVPTTEQLRQQANDLYSQAEQRGVTASPAQTANLRDNLAKILLDEGQMGPAGPITNADTSTSKAINLIDQYAGLPMSPAQMNTTRKVLSEGRSSMDASDRRLASILLDEFDQFTAPLAPEFADARSVASRYLTAEDLEQARELAELRSNQFTNSGIENALRTEYRALDRDNIKGRSHFPDPVLDAITKVSRGTPLSNLARNVGKAAPTGAVPTLASAGLPFMIGNALGGPALGGIASAATMGAGTLGRNAATNMSIRNAELAELIARNGGALEQAPLVNSQDELMAALLLASQSANASQNGGGY